MSEHVVVIGAVALGPKAACRFKRIRQDAKVTLIDRDEIFHMAVVVSLIMFPATYQKQINFVPPLFIWLEMSLFSMILKG